jgi:hypothetical protein
MHCGIWPLEDIIAISLVVNVWELDAVSSAIVKFVPDNWRLIT